VTDWAAAFRELESVYADLADDIKWANPLCVASGNCCNFAEAGHELWTTPLEFEYLVRHEDLRRAPSKDTCPFLTADKKCGVRNHRMFGCRVYFCDKEYFKNHMTRLHEKYFPRIKQIMRQHGIPYEYFRFMDRIGAALETPSNPPGAPVVG